MCPLAGHTLLNHRQREGPERSWNRVEGLFLAELDAHPDRPASAATRLVPVRRGLSSGSPRARASFSWRDLLMWLSGAGTTPRAGRPWTPSTTFLWCSWLAGRRRPGVRCALNHRRAGTAAWRTAG